MTRPLKNTPNRHALSLAQRLGILAFVAATVLWFADPRLAIIPLSVFVALCLVAPFLPRFGFFLPIISKGTSGKRAVALTFDDGPDPRTTPAVLQLLQASNIMATFFVTGQKAADHPDLIRDILSRGHAIGNHSFHHDNLVMLKSSAVLKQEIEATQVILRKFGIEPRAFRPPVGITNPKLGPILDELGMFAVNFSCRGFDAGNRYIKRLSSKILHRVRPDDIIVLHDTMPGHGVDGKALVIEIDRIISGLDAKRFEIRPLHELINRPVMKKY